MVETAAKLIPAIWITDPAVADRLLGAEARHLLDDVVDNIRQAAPENGWPLTQIDIDYHQDMEFEWWEYLLLTLHFDSPWEEAQDYWRACLRTVVKPMQDNLPPEEKELFIKTMHRAFRSRR